MHSAYTIDIGILRADSDVEPPPTPKLMFYPLHLIFFDRTASERIVIILWEVGGRI